MKLSVLGGDHFLSSNTEVKNTRSLTQVEVTSRLTVSQSVCFDIEHPCWTCDQILLPVEMLLSEICGHLSVGRPLWWQDGSQICSAVTQWPESLRTENRTLLSYLRLPKPGGPGSRIYIPQEQGGPVISPGTMGPELKSKSKLEVTLRLTVSQSVSMSWYWASF
jgi:hypothetical protein